MTSCFRFIHINIADNIVQREQIALTACAVMVTPIGNLNIGVMYVATMTCWWVNNKFKSFSYIAVRLNVISTPVDVP